MEQVDVVVIGAGAAGLMAAAEAAARGRRVVLLEKNKRPGLKILISGGGRCNLTTTRSGPDLEAQYGRARGRFLRHALRSFTPVQLRTLVEKSGVPLQEEDLEKIFPVSRKAADILGVFVERAAQAGAELRLECPMLGVDRDGDPEGGPLIVHTPRGTIRCTSIVLATGGLSYPKTGATGDGYPIARQFGHDLVDSVPALAPLQVDEPWLLDLHGIVLDAEIEVCDPTGRSMVKRRRPCLITHRGLSGPAPMDVSGAIEERHGEAQLRLDVCPDLESQEIDSSLLEAARTHGRRSVHTALPEHLPERFRHALVAKAGAGGSLAELGKNARKRLVVDLKRLVLRCERSIGFHAAEVTRGGVVLGQVDAKTMRSRLDPRLFLCGEILDIDGPIGGFNFQAAFATGRLAGLHA
ncbi:MAG: aminoacetone oxidase family FAD-binding enzyme [Planctomycetota bacterium]